ncbi:MAG: FHA domain-containing protein, partial [Candidatus Heimdallarchaeota archaeon]|nr:FHA domain-containing protein [Candidatus Heimdallarchaeota archaeon]
ARIKIVSEYAVLAEESFMDDDDFLNSVMPLVEGQNLRDILSRRGFLDERCSVYVSLCLARAACDLHASRILACDIKPENTMIAKDGKAILIDLTFFQHVGAKPKTRMGTEPYAPPELIKGELLSESTDVYSIGMTFCELLVGEDGFNSLTNLWQQFSDAPDLRSVYQRFPRASQIIGNAIHPEPKKRYKTSRQLFMELLNYYNAITCVQSINHNRLVLVCDNGKGLGLQKGMYVIGRNQIDPPNYNISERHFEIDYTGNGKPKIKDKGSTNGTIVNGERLNGSWKKLSDGDILQIADVRLRVKLKT